MKRYAKFLLQGALLCMLAYLSYLMLRLSMPYAAMRNDVDFLQTKQNVYHIRYWRFSFYAHVFTSILVLVAGLTQFSSYLLRHYKQLHRVAGYVYVLVVVFITGPAAILMGLHANGGLPARTSFVLLSALWVVFTAAAWYNAVKRRFLVHGAFMYRSYALTLSALTLRIYTVAMGWMHVQASPRDIYITTAWLSWVPNLLLAEWLIRRGSVKKIMKLKKPT